MTVTYDAATKTARMQAVADKIDAGSGPGTLEIGTAGMGTVLATITLADPCGTVSGSVLTLSGFPRSDTSADATGTAAAARIRDSDGNSRITGLTVTATGGGGDVQLGTTSITAGLQVDINSATFTHAA